MTPEPLIVNLAPTGMIPTKAMTPHVPIETGEILEDVAACRELGASIIHVHAREPDGTPTHRPEYFAPIVEGIRAIDPELIVCVTCSGRFVSDPAARAEVLHLTGDAKPDMGSLTLGSNNFARHPSINAPATIRMLAGEMLAHGIKPELEVFEPGMLAFGAHIQGEGLLEPPCYVNILLGSPGTAPATPGVLGAFLALLPAQWTWALAGIGRRQLQANLLGIASGGHVRVGLEDNIWFDDARTTLATNHMLVERVVHLAEVAERPIASAREVRRLLGIERPVALKG